MEEFDNLFGSIEEMPVSGVFVFVLGTVVDRIPYWTQLAVDPSERIYWTDKAIFNVMFYELVEYTK